MAQNLSVPFLPLFLAEELDIKNNLSLWASATYSVTFLLGAVLAPFWGSVSDRYGRKRLISITGVGLIIVYFSMSFVDTAFQLLICRLLAGALAGYMTFSNALVSTNTPVEKSGYALSMVYSVGSLGFVFGPLIGGVSATALGYRGTFVLSAVMVVVSVLAITFIVKEEKFSKTKRKMSLVAGLKEAFSNKALVGILFSLLILQSSITLILPLISLFVIELDVNSGSASIWAGVLFSVYGLSSVIGAPLWGKLGEKYGYHKCLLVGAIVGGVFNVLQVFSTSILMFAILRFLYGVFAAAIIPSINTLITKNTEPEFRGRAFGLNQSSSEIGRVVGPNLGGFLADLTSLRTVFALNGVLLVIIPILLLPKLKLQKNTK